MASRELIERAGKALADAAGADSKVILFGSYARGDQRQDSDLDFLVIEPEVDDQFGESVRKGARALRAHVPRNRLAGKVADRPTLLLCALLSSSV
jgi:predicted nucleotidyltransferase